MQTYPKQKRGTSIYVHNHTHAQYYWYMPYTTHTHSHTDQAFPVTRQSWDTAVWEGARAQRSCERQGGGGQEEREQTEEIKEVGRQNRGTILRQRGPNIQRGVSSITCIRAEDRVNGGGGNLTQIWTLTVRDIPRADRHTDRESKRGWVGTSGQRGRPGLI